MGFLEFQDFKGHEVHHLEGDPLAKAIASWRARSSSSGSSESSGEANPTSASAYKERSQLASRTQCLEAFYAHLGSQLQRFDIDERACTTVGTGCQRSAIGMETLQQLQQAHPKTLPIALLPEVHKFCSVHGVSCTSQVACIPSSLRPNGCILRPAVFQESHSSKAPFLLSLPFLLERRTTLELQGPVHVCQTVQSQD